MRHRPRALFWDLDGTLVDSRRDIADALNAALVVHGRAALALEQVLPLIGDGARALVARAFGREEIDEELATFQRIYAANPCGSTTLLPGAREALRLGIPQAIVTNKPTAITRLVLDGLGIGGYFRAIWGGGDGPLKPSPAGVLAMASALGVGPEEAWMIGDGPQDVAAGKAAGCFTVVVPGIADHERTMASRPDLVLASLADLASAVSAGSL